MVATHIQWRQINIPAKARKYSGNGSKLYVAVAATHSGEIAAAQYLGEKGKKKTFDGEVSW